jgi:4'-phosphopantetheinyl transferase
MTEAIEVEVIRAHVADVPDLQPYRAALTEDERRRADAYLTEEPKGTFTLARGLLRLELAKRLGCALTDIAFDLRSSGKPDLRPTDPARPDWRFSVSHTGPHVALAFARATDVGIDIERLDRTVAPLAIARRYFTALEFASLMALPEDERPRAFFAGWTRKEAVVKARGGTMAESLTTLSVSLDPEALHPGFADSKDAPPRLTARLTTFEFPALSLMGAVAVCSDQPPRLRISVL